MVLQRRKGTVCHFGSRFLVVGSIALPVWVRSASSDEYAASTGLVNRKGPIEASGRRLGGRKCCMVIHSRIPVSSASPLCLGQNQVDSRDGTEADT